MTIKISEVEESYRDPLEIVRIAAPLERMRTPEQERPLKASDTQRRESVPSLQRCERINLMFHREKLFPRPRPTVSKLALSLRIYSNQVSQKLSRPRNRRALELPRRLC